MYMANSLSVYVLGSKSSTLFVGTRKNCLSPLSSHEQD